MNAKISSPRWPLFGAVGAGILASACCTLPLLLVLAGVSGAWLSTFKALEPLRPIFIVLAGGLLFFAYRRVETHSGPEVCEPGSDCAKPETKRRNKIVLWLAAILTLLLAASPTLIGIAFGAATGDESELRSCTLAVEGMTCATCPLQVKSAAKRVDGVKEVEVSLKDATARIVYDPKKTTPEALAVAISGVGYPATVIPETP